MFFFEKLKSGGHTLTLGYTWSVMLAIVVKDDPPPQC